MSERNRKPRASYVRGLNGYYWRVASERIVESWGPSLGFGDTLEQAWKHMRQVEACILSRQTGVRV